MSRSNRSVKPRSAPASQTAQPARDLASLVDQIALPALILDPGDLAIHHNGHAQVALDATGAQLAARPVWDFLEACHALELALANTRRGDAPGAIVTVASRRRGQRLQATLLALREARDATLVLLQELPEPSALPDETHEHKLATLGTLIATVVHELKTPLTYARNNLEVARSGLGKLAAANPATQEEANRLRRMSEDAIEGIERANSIIASLQPLAKNRRRQRAAADVSDIVVTAAKQYRVVNPGGARVSLDLQAMDELVVDKDEVVAALLNLLRNAAQACGAQGRITIETRSEPRARIRVIDHGPGIPPEHAAHLFEPFHTTKKEGTGLGLFIARQAILANGATLEHEATPGGGATFTIQF
ncbi:MAG TPA: ATP-binding protein [Candidatus Thermoplasmatota archaeon]|nr:ATP-binding protein [Candidatus Thermoplasmatota archaeon]